MAEEKGLLERAKDKAEEFAGKEDKSVPKFRKAVDWALAESLEKHDAECGICGWKPWLHNKEQSLRAHITRKHRSTIVDLYDRQVMNLADLNPTAPSEDDDELFATAGITRVEDLDRHDYLAVPDAIKSKIEGDGGVGRWVRQDRIEHFKGQGAIVTSGDGANQPSSEDGSLRTNEMTHVTIPHELAERRQKQKDQRISDQLAARAEEQENTRDAYQQKSYDYLRKERGLDHSKAEQVSKALAGRRQREGGDGGGTSISERR
jgi:hypothetical protein